VPQVQIEARFICAEKGFEENIGFQWSGIYNRRASINRGVDIVGGGRPLSDISNNPKPQSEAGLVDWALNLVPAPAARGLRLPFVFGGSDLNTKRLNLLLNAAEDRSEIKTILQPTVLTNDREPAEILVGENVPIETIVEESVEGRLRNVKTASYKDIGIQLKVKPIVSPDKRSVILDIFIENSHQSEALTPEQTSYPVIRTTRSHTTVRLQSKQTTMISGLIKDVKEGNKTKVPWLGSIPIIGWLFKGSRKRRQEMQLLIFITPTVIEKDAA
jgi:Type II secretory pathway, component PulD